MGLLSDLEQYHASHDCQRGPCQCACGCQKERGCIHPFGPYCAECFMNYVRNRNDECRLGDQQRGGE